MNNEIKSMPMLRFREFANDEGWKEKNIGEFAPLQRGFDLPVDNIISGPYPVVFSNGILKHHHEHKVKGPGVVTGRSGTIGKITYVKDDFWPHNTSLWVTDFFDNYPLFVYYYFDFIGLKQFGTGSGVPTLNRNDVHIHKLFVTNNIREQKKIASCLLSLDELIAIHNDKLEVLKDHKKGLMQNLFLKESDKVPKYRFPQFEKGGDWVKETVGKVYEFKVTNSFSREYLNYEQGKVKNIHYGDIHTKFNTLFDITKENVPFINQTVSIDKIKIESYCTEGDIIFADASEDLNDVGKSIEIVNLDSQKLVSGLHTLLARQREKKLAIGFGGYLFKSDWVRRQIQRESQGAKILGVSATRISDVKIAYPQDPIEQQKIASCLSTLDELITNQIDKLVQLKLHKKGLMQGLFPKAKK